MDNERKAVALCDAIKNVVENLQCLDLAIQETFNFVLEEDEPAAANDPEHRQSSPPTPPPLIIPDWMEFTFAGQPEPKPHENFFARLNVVIEEDFGGSMNALATSRNISQKTLWTWLSEGKGRSPTCSMIYEVCDKLGWNYHDALSPLGSLQDKH